MRLRNLFKYFHTIICLALIIAFAGSSLYIPQAQAGEMVLPSLPVPGVMVQLSPEFTPAHLQGLTIHPDNALKFDFLIHKGDGQLDNNQKKIEYTKLVKYFLASLTIPDEDQWVNLSPYEHNRIIKDDFGKTEMGRDLLSQDYLLKQITSSLMYPEQGLGRKFWDRVYERAWKEYGTTNIPVNTFNKVWIIPDEAAVYESGNTVYILRNHLKVMLEEDYLSLQKHSAIGVIAGEAKQSFKIASSLKNAPRNDTNYPANEAIGPFDTHRLASQIIKVILLPELEREVNEGKNFAMLRQIYSGMILATWYKHALKESLLGRVYANKAKVIGVNQKDPKANEAIYQRYLKAFKKGVFNYIKEDEDKYSQQVIPRKYFAGGLRGFDGAMTGVAAQEGFRDGAVVVLGDGTRIPASIQNKVDFASIAQEIGSIDRAAVALNTEKDVKSGILRRTFILSTAGLVAAAKRGFATPKDQKRVKPMNLKQIKDALKNGTMNEDALLVYLISGEVKGLNKWFTQQAETTVWANQKLAYADVLLKLYQYGIDTGISGLQFKNLFSMLNGDDRPASAKAFEILQKIAQINSYVLNALKQLEFNEKLSPFLDALAGLGNITARRWRLAQELKKEKPEVEVVRPIKFSSSIIMDDFEVSVQSNIKNEPLLDLRQGEQDAWRKFRSDEKMSGKEWVFVLNLLDSLNVPFYPEEIRKRFNDYKLAEDWVKKQELYWQLQLLPILYRLGDPGAGQALKNLKYDKVPRSKDDWKEVLMLAEMENADAIALARRASLESLKGRPVGVHDFDKLKNGAEILGWLGSIGYLDNNGIPKDDPELVSKLYGKYPEEEAEAIQIILKEAESELFYMYQGRKTLDQGLENLLLTLWKKWGNPSAGQLLDGIAVELADAFSQFQGEESTREYYLSELSKQLLSLFADTNSQAAYSALVNLKFPEWFKNKGKQVLEKFIIIVLPMIERLRDFGNADAVVLFKNATVDHISSSGDVEKYLRWYKEFGNSSARDRLMALTPVTVGEIRYKNFILALLDLRVPAAQNYVLSLKDDGGHIPGFTPEEEQIFLFRKFEMNRNRGLTSKMHSRIWDAKTDKLLHRSLQISEISKGERLEVYQYFKHHPVARYSPLEASVNFFHNPLFVQLDLASEKVPMMQKTAGTVDEVISLIVELAADKKSYLELLASSQYQDAARELEALYKHPENKEAIRNKLIEILQGTNILNIMSQAIFRLLRSLAADDGKPADLLAFYQKYFDLKADGDSYAFLDIIFNSRLFQETPDPNPQETQEKLMAAARDLFEHYKTMGFSNGGVLKSVLTNGRFSSTMHFQVHRLVSFFVLQQDLIQLNKTLNINLPLLGASEVKSQVLDIFRHSEIVSKYDPEVGNANSIGQLNPGFLYNMNDLLLFYMMNWHEFGHKMVDAFAPWIKRLMEKYAKVQGLDQSPLPELTGIHELGADVLSFLIAFLEKASGDYYLKDLMFLGESTGNGALDEMFAEVMSGVKIDLAPEEIIRQYIDDENKKEGHAMARGFLAWLSSERSEHGGVLRGFDDWKLLFITYLKVIEDIGKAVPEPAAGDLAWPNISREKIYRAYKTQRDKAMKNDLKRRVFLGIPVVAAGAAAGAYLYENRDPDFLTAVEFGPNIRRLQNLGLIGNARQWRVEVTGSKAKELMDAFQQNNAANDLREKLDNINGLNKEGDIIAVASGKRRMLLIKDSRNVYLAMDTKGKVRIFDNNISSNDGPDDLDNYLVVPDYAKTQRLYIEKSAVKEFPVNERTRIDAVTHRGFSIGDGKNLSWINGTYQNGILRALYGMSLIKDGVPQKDYPIYLAIRKYAADGMEMFRRVLEDPVKRVVGISEQHEDPGLQYKMILQNAEILKKNNYVIGLELDREKNITYREETNGPEKHMTILEFFEGYNKKKWNEVIVTQVISEIINHHMGGRDTGYMVEDFIRTAHTAGLEIMPMENRLSVYKAYRENPKGFTNTRDHFMFENIKKILEDKSKRVLMIVGGDHLSSQDSFKVFGDTNSDGSIAFSYSEHRSLGARLKAFFPESEVEMIAIRGEVRIGTILRDVLNAANFISLHQAFRRPAQFSFWYDFGKNPPPGPIEAAVKIDGQERIFKEFERMRGIDHVIVLVDDPKLDPKGSNKAMRVMTVRELIELPAEQRFNVIHQQIPFDSLVELHRRLLNLKPDIYQKTASEVGSAILRFLIGFTERENIYLQRLDQQQLHALLIQTQAEQDLDITDHISVSMAQEHWGRLRGQIRGVLRIPAITADRFLMMTTDEQDVILQEVIDEKGLDNLVTSIDAVKGLDIKKRLDALERIHLRRAKIREDFAMKTHKIQTPLGGIDLNSANMKLQIKRDGRGVPLPLLQQDWAQLSQIQGFIPTITEIRPATAIPLLRELRQKLRTTTPPNPSL